MVTEFGRRVGGIRPGEDGPGRQDAQNKDWVVYLLCLVQCAGQSTVIPCTYVIKGMDTHAIAGSDACGMEAGRQLADENQGLVTID
jgi:hypothetical protein